MPTPTSYTYSIADDFSGGSVNTSKLSAEIRASAIVTALDRIDTAGDVLDVWFRDVLSDGDKTILDGDAAGPAGGLIAANDSSPSQVTPVQRADGVLYTVPKPSSFGYEMSDRDFRINPCMVAQDDAVEDWKVNTQTNLEEDWNELSTGGVYKLVNGAMVEVDDQADADANGILSVWDYQAKLGGNPIHYEVRDGCLYVDPALPANERWDHRAYAVAVPGVPAAYGGSVAVFDAYLGPVSGGLIEARSPQAMALDPNGPAGAAGSVIRLYIFHPAGSRLSHVLTLVTYRAPGTF